VLFNKFDTEDELDLKRLEMESNKKFYEINKAKGFYDYMIGSDDVSSKMFVAPLFTRDEFDSILSLKKSQMDHKLFFLRSLKHSQKLENEKIKDLCGGEYDEVFDEKDLEDRTFTLKRERRCESVNNKHRYHDSEMNMEIRESFHETAQEKVYRQSTFLDYNILSLMKSIEENKTDTLQEQLQKEFSIKQFSDVIESLVAGVYEKSGLHGAQMFCKSLGLLTLKDNKYKEEFDSLVGELKLQETRSYITNPEFKQVEEILGHKFEIKKLLVIALTHKSYNTDKKANANFFNSYENLEYLGDAVHKFFVVKRIKKMYQQDKHIFDNDGNI
jgi:dsRNA-specific ribonuclease